MSIGTRVAPVLAALSLLLGAGTATAEERSMLNMPQGATELSHKVYDLHMMAFWVCVAIGVVVFGAMFYAVFAFRRSKHPTPAQWHESTAVEIIWTIIPFVILIAMAYPAAGTLIKMYDTRNADLTIKITGIQWRWQYDYLDSGVSFISSLGAESNKARQLNSGIDPNTVPNYLLDVDRNLVVPVGKKVRLLITSNDVIHGWWVPDLAVKRDAIPGFVNEVAFKVDQPGILRGQCTVLCGRDHGFMPIVVEALPQDQYDAWIKKQGGTQVATAVPASLSDAAPAVAAVAAAAAPAATEVAAAAPAEAKPEEKTEAKPAAAKMDHDALMKQGETVYKANCAACHQVAGTGMPPTFPTLVGSKVANGPAADHVTQIIKGKNAMPPFGQLSDADIAAVASYERGSWGNKGGDVQPSDVAALRK